MVCRPPTYCSKILAIEKEHVSPLACVREKAKEKGDDFLELINQHVAEADENTMEKTLADMLEEVEKVLRCFRVYIPEWQPLFINTVTFESF